MKNFIFFLLLIISLTSCKSNKSKLNTQNSPSNKEDSITENLLFMNASDSLIMFFQDEK